ncbi:MAG: putative bifunctional diguanylate cyclase/phosphodiesterase [Eubacteriales bacterium]
MLDWSLLNELYSLCILLILFIRYRIYDKGVVQTKRREMFISCLLLSVCYIALNILCVFLLELHAYVPVWLNITVNTLYFLGSMHLCSLYAYIIFDAMLEHVYDKHCMKRARRVLIIISSLATLFTLSNLFTGWVFRVDSDGYHTGPLTWVYYAFVIAELFFLCLCYIKNRKSISDRVVYVVRSIPIVIFLVLTLQILYPKVLLNGTMCAIASLVIFVAFRSNTENSDSLTGVQNRNAFMNELSLRSDSGQAVQIIQVSILNISDINLRHNYKVGDALLYEVSRFLSHALNGAGVFRTGGTTFTVLLPYLTDEQAQENIATVQNRLQSIWEIGDVKCHLTVSIAEMRTQNLTGTPAQIFEKIEYTMALAKKNPPLVRFDSAVSQQFERRNYLLGYLRHAIDNKLFTVNYQPLYCCHKDIFCSAEALLRLNDGDGKPISPDIFIPLAEQNGLIEEMTWLVLEDVCNLFKSGRYPGLQYVSVNLSMRQFLDPHLPEEIVDYLEQRGLSTDKIKVEITERFLLHDAEYARWQMEKLHSLGIQVFMDDFGTGYSNLSSVLQYPFSFIKLDRSLIENIADNSHALTMVGSLIKLFGDMDMRVIAEGVETKEQADLLRSLGIDMIQGFYLSKPATVDNLEKYFEV